MYLEWHPTAENILLSAGYDHLIIVWNIAKGQCVNVIDCHEDTIYSMSFNRYSRHENKQGGRGGSRVRRSKRRLRAALVV